MQHQYYGDTRTLQRKFSSLVKYTENLISNADSSASNAHEGLAVCDQFKDWLCGNAQSCCTNKGSPSCPVGCVSTALLQCVSTSPLLWNCVLTQQALLFGC